MASETLPSTGDSQQCDCHRHNETIFAEARTYSSLDHILDIYSPPQMHRLHVPVATWKRSWP